MALKAIIARRGSVLEDLNAGHLVRTRRSGNDIVTFAAADTIVIAVSEDSFEIVLRSRRPVVWCKFMANAALAQLCVGGVAIVTSRMRFDADRYRLAGAGRLMTSDASLRGSSRPTLVHRVVKPHIESLNEFCRKRFDRRLWSLRVRVADRAHRLIFVDELIQMTADARFVAAELAFHALRFPKMACIAGKLRMLGDLVRKRLKGFVRYALRDRIRRIRRR